MEWLFFKYADYTIIFMKHGIEGARNMKLLLYLYMSEMMAGLKINLNKSEVVVINDDNSRGSIYAAKLASS
jgi:hypothetical protein